MFFMDTLKVDLKLPGLSIAGVWKYDEKEKAAAWELYVELVTRVSITKLDGTEGSLREALSSLYSLFATARSILKNYGPSVAKSKGTDGLSFGYLTLCLLNTVLRPLLSNWHPRLGDWEASKADNVSAFVHERGWKHNKELRDDLEKSRIILRDYGLLLEQVSGIPSLIEIKDLDL